VHNGQTVCWDGQEWAAKPPAPPDEGTIQSISLIHCASDNARAMSLAATSRIQGTNWTGKLGLAVLDNTFSGIYDVFQDLTRPSGNGFPDFVKDVGANGLRLGLGGNGLVAEGGIGTAQDFVLNKAFRNVRPHIDPFSGTSSVVGTSGRALAGALGWAKIAYDFGTFVGGIFQCF